MQFDDMLNRVRETLVQEGRVSYRALKRRFELSDDDIEDIKIELIDAKRVAADENGTVLVHVDSAASMAPKDSVAGPDDADRRLLTVMFCDIVDSTAYSERFEAEELRDLIREYQQTCANVIERFHGYIAQYLGDGLLVYFGYPVAQEDEAYQAVSAALEIMSTLDSATHFIERLGAPLRVRIGIHSGPVVIGEVGAVGRQERLALGDTPNIAARVQSAARPSEILISDSTHRLVEGMFDAAPLGKQDLKGISNAVNLYRVDGEADQQSRFEVALSTGKLATFTGRGAERDELRRYWDAAREGHGQVVLLSAEPGMGKSRLVQQFKDDIAPEATRQMVFRCSPYHQSSPFYPVIQILERYLQFAPRDTAEDKSAKLSSLIATSEVIDAEAALLLRALLSISNGDDAAEAIDPAEQRDRLLAILVEWVLESADDTTLYVVWDDIHWADPSTLELLNAIVERAPHSSTLAVLVYRSNFTAPWTTGPSLSMMDLPRLNDNEVGQLAADVAGRDDVAPALLQHIVERTDGIPLFVEELTKTLVDTDSFDAAGDDPAGDQIPATLQDLFEARLDRCRIGKEIAQWGATIGREFAYAVLRAVVGDDDKVNDGINELLEAELIYRSGSFAEPKFIFKHALLRDTAYESLLIRRRREYHARIAKTLESDFPHINKTLPEVIAGHFTEGGLVDDAIRYWHRAGIYAIERSAEQEAREHLARGLDLLREQARTRERAQLELDMQLLLGPLIIGAIGNAAPEVRETYLRALEVCDEIDAPGSKVPVYFGLRSHYLASGDLRAEHRIARALMQATEAGDDEDSLLEAHAALSNSFFFIGNEADSTHHARAAAALYDPARHRGHAAIYGIDPGVNARVRVAQGAWQMGYQAQADDEIRAALDLVSQVFHPLSHTFAFCNLATVNHWTRDHDASARHAGRALDIANEHGYRFYHAWAQIQHGSARVHLGDTGGMDDIESAMGAVAQIRDHLIYPWFVTLQAEACGVAGDPERGLAMIPDATASMERSHARYCEAYLYCVKGELLRLAKLNSEAERAFMTATELARERNAKAMTVRAALGLARLDATTHADRLRAAVDALPETDNNADLNDALSVLRTSAA